MGACLTSNCNVLGKNMSSNYKSMRPPLNKRQFVSEAVEKTIAEVKKAIKNPELAWMFENCFPNTLDTTVTYKEIDGRPDTFVITGDIHAMWLRDSTANHWSSEKCVPLNAPQPTDKIGYAPITGATKRTDPMENAA